ncbi:MAG: KipI antagonist, partial [Bacillota bacterium]|nr:KipI antagonist [Bacillota bacterium]
MLADRQTTGGYTKIGVLSPLSIEALVQKMPGNKVRFRKAVVQKGADEQKRIKDAVRRVKELYASYVSRPEVKAAAAAAAPLSTHFRLTVEGKSYDITCEEIS